MITLEQQNRRKQFLGSSDIPAVLGLDSYRSAADVWLEKTGQVESFEGNEATARGNYLEPALIKYATDRLKWMTFEAGTMVVHANGVLACNLDANSPDLTEIIEAKSTVLGAEWGEEMSEQVPERVQAQVAHQFVCVPEARIAWIPVIIPGYRSFDFRLYRVERNHDLCEIVKNAGTEFMRKYVIARVPPDDFRPTLDVLKRMKREPNKIVDVSDELVAAYKQAAENSKQSDKAKEAAQAALIASIGDAEAGRSSLGDFTYMTTKRAGYEVAATEYRSIRFKKGK